jgi:hypothetical protein
MRHFSWCEVLTLMLAGLLFLVEGGAMFAVDLWPTVRLLGIFWIVLRVIDLMIHGPQRRDRAHAAKPIDVTYRQVR